MLGKFLSRNTISSVEVKYSCTKVLVSHNYLLLLTTKLTYSYFKVLQTTRKKVNIKRLPSVKTLDTPTKEYNYVGTSTNIRRCQNFNTQPRLLTRDLSHYKLFLRKKYLNLKTIT